MSNSPNLQLPFLDANQNQKHVTHNAALLILDILVNTAVVTNALATPPSSPGDGLCWIVAPNGTGAWAGKDLQLAAWQDGSWSFFTPRAGFVAFAANLATLVVWTGNAWSTISTGGGGGGGGATLGVNGAAADTTNRLAVKSNAILFDWDETTPGAGDMRLAINKKAAGNTASMLFQEAFSGRAEVGLTGSDDFHFKVSADGQAWREAIVLQALTGLVAMAFGATTLAPDPGDNSTRVPTTAWVNQAISLALNGQPGVALDLGGGGNFDFF